MDLLSLVILCFGLLAFSLISRRLQGTVLTAPLIFVAFGLVVGPGGLEFVQIETDHSAVHLIAEITLILVLFADAARIDLRLLRRDHNLPERMLAIGLPLIMLAGAGLAMVVFPAFSIWEAALLAAVLAPTDAALGQAVVTDRRVPVRIRQSLNVESGLNDGIALPAVLVFAALASTAGAAAGGTAVPGVGDWIVFGLLQVTLGPLAGILVGYAGARLVDSAITARWMSGALEGMAILAVAFLAYGASELIGGNGFIAAFTAGLMFGNAVRHRCAFLFRFMETEGQILMLVTFLLFGAVMLPDAVAHLDWRVVLFAVASLTVIRMLPIALSLLGAGVRVPTYAFLGWFGPRGLASILFALLIVEEAAIPHGEEILVIAVSTVALSILLHGVTAAPFARAYGRAVARMGDCAESRPVGEMPTRVARLDTQK